MNSMMQEAAVLREFYEQQPVELFRASWHLNWWKRGGEPGPDWLSDNIDLVTIQGRTKGQYIRTRNAPMPPFQSQAEKFTGEIPPEIAVKLLQTLFIQRIFERTFPSEQRINLADAVSQTFDLTLENMHLVKTLYEPDIADLGDVAYICDAVAEHLRVNGFRRDVSRVVD